jgi:probable F420-dependent oxidoreductase
MVRVWVSSGFLPEQEVLELAPGIERLGYDGMTFPDHVFTPVTPDLRYPYSADGKPPFRHETPWPDTLVLIAAVAALTTRLQLMTAVEVVPLRHPLLFAKAAATAARISGGRLTLGVGAGWQPDEFEALGVDFEHRGGLLSEAIDAMRALWGEQPVEHRAKHYSFGPLQMEPVPPPIPIIVGGGSDAALRRATALGDGWIMPGQPLAGVPEQLERLDAALAQAERSGEGFRVFIPALGAGAAELAAVLGPTVTDMTVMPWPHPGKEDTTVAHKLVCLERWREEVFAPLTAAAAP